MNKIFCLVSFIGGLTIGSVVTWKISKKRYVDILNKEVESVKEEFAKNKKIFADEVIKEKESEIKANVAKEKPDISNYADILKGSGYVKYRKEESTKANKDDEPYIIAMERFGENEEYSAETIKYYISDDTFTDDNDEILEDLDIIPADEIREYFSSHKSEDDCLYSRNERLKTDFEILLVLISYDEILAEKPYLNSARITDD